MNTGNLRDIDGVPIKAGQKLVRAVDGQGTDTGYEYEVIEEKFSGSSKKPSLIADGGFIQELLYPERAVEFRVINE